MPVLLLHHRYRVHGGEERAVDDLAWLLREQLGEEVHELQRDSARVGGAAAAAGLLGGGLVPERVARVVRERGIDLVHAHNVHPTWGARALEAARAAGAAVVLHLHNYRLVCAVGTCFTHGEDCTRCHARRTWPGVRLNCRGARGESLVYAAGIAAQQRRLCAAADAFAVPSAFALGRLRELGAPLGDRAHVLPSVQRAFADGPVTGGSHVLYAGRLSEEKGVLELVAACAAAQLPLVVAGAGPAEAAMRAAAGAGVRFTGRVGAAELAALRASAAVAAVPSRYAEILPLAALEAMAAGLPVVASRAGGLSEAVPPEGLVAPGDAPALGAALQRLWGDAGAGERALAAARALCSPPVVAARLAELYALARARVGTRL